MKIENNVNDFSFLKDLALNLGASAAKIIQSNEVIIENRVLKCRIGCKYYGKTLMCPPFSPSVEEFKKILKE